MKVTKTRLKEIIQEELAAVQEAAIDPTSARVSAGKRKKDIDDERARCISDKTKQWDPKEISKPGSFPKKLKRACKDKVKEELAAVAAEGWEHAQADTADAAASRGIDIYHTYEDVLHLSSYLDTEEERDVLERAAEILKNYSGVLEEGELEEGMFGLTTDASCKTELDKQNNMWMSRVNDLYQALRAIDSAAADTALDKAGMTAGDLRPAEPARLEE